MRRTSIITLPLALIFFLFLFLVLIILTIAVSSVFRALGFSPFTTILLFFLVLVGSTINIPLYTKMFRQPVRMRPPSFSFGFLYPERDVRYTLEKTTIGVNLGGAIIPALVSVYLIYTHLELLLPFSIGILIVSMMSYRFSRIVPGVGISLPLFIPPLTAALIAIVLPQGPNTVIAFVSGVVGVLIGADLMNLDDLTKIQSETVSIGGAGTFDGIFLTGIVSVLIAAI